MKATIRLVAAGLCVLIGAWSPTVSAADPAIDPTVDALVHLNQIQVVGSHNSYHRRASQGEYEIRQSVAPAYNIGLDYDHPELGIQFDSQRVRQIELDLYADPLGGRYADPLLRTLSGDDGFSVPEQAAMAAPGIKVLHANDVDHRSNCLTFVACLEAVKAWSDAHPDHVPIAILVELKDDPIPIVPSPPAVTPIPWDATNIATLDAEIASVFAPGQVITPDEVRGAHATVEAGVLAGNWPTLGDSRGKVLFLMDNGGRLRHAYLDVHPGLVGASVFTNASPGDPDAAFVKVNDPTGDNLARIQDLVARGYVVRTRADGDTLEARTNDTTKRDAAFASGAQWVSTDFAGPDAAAYLRSPYGVELPSGTTARCNPINAPVGCIDAVLDVEPVLPLPPDAHHPVWVVGRALDTAGSATPPHAAPRARPVPARPSYTG